MGEGAECAQAGPAPGQPQSSLVKVFRLWFPPHTLEMGSGLALHISLPGWWPHPHPVDHGVCAKAKLLPAPGHLQCLYLLNPSLTPWAAGSRRVRFPLPGAVLAGLSSTQQISWIWICAGRQSTGNFFRDRAGNGSGACEGAWTDIGQRQ